MARSDERRTRKRRSKRKKKKKSNNNQWSASQEESDEYHSAEDGEYGDQQSSDDEYFDADDEEPDYCIICGGNDNHIINGKLMRGVCGCMGSLSGVYHFPCLADWIKTSRDAPCICGQQFTDQRIRRVRYMPVWQRVHESVSGVTLIMFLALVNFGSYLASLIYRAPNVPPMMRIVLFIALFCIIAYILPPNGITYEEIFEWDQQ